MNYTMENEYLQVTVTTDGAQIKSVKRKCDNVEHIWQADPDLWPKHGPILFPYPSRIRGGVLTAKGKEYPGGIHGFAKDMEHTLVAQTENSIILERKTSEETPAMRICSLASVTIPALPFPLIVTTLPQTMNCVLTALNLLCACNPAIPAVSEK